MGSKPKAEREQSVIGKSEKTWDDLKSLFMRRPVLAVAVSIFILAPTVGWLVQGTWGATKTKRALTDARAELAETRLDRDLKATQLAPFLAAAQRSFSDAPPDKRLELLSARIESLEKFAAERTPQLISSNALWAAQTRMAGLGTSITWWVQPEFADLESASLVRQISHVLLFAGSGSVSPPGSLAVDPVSGIRVEYSPGLQPWASDISNAFYGICKDLNRRLLVAVHNDLGATNGLSVTVGTR